MLHRPSFQASFRVMLSNHEQTSHFRDKSASPPQQKVKVNRWQSRSKTSKNKTSQTNMFTISNLKSLFWGFMYVNQGPVEIAFSSLLAISQLVELKGPQLIMVFVTKFLRRFTVLHGKNVWETRHTCGVNWKSENEEKIKSYKIDRRRMDMCLDYTLGCSVVCSLKVHILSN